MPEYRPLAVERQVYLIGIWRSVTLNDIFLKEIQIQEEKITDKICQLQLSPSGLFVFSKSTNYNTGLENGIPLHKIYSIASKKTKPEHLLCIIDEEKEGKFAVILLRCNTLKDSFSIQNTMKELWNVCFMSEKQFFVKSNPSGRVKSRLSGSYGSDQSSDQSWQKSSDSSEKSDEVYSTGSLLTVEDFTKYQNTTQTYMETIREQLNMIFSEIYNVKVYLKTNDITDSQNLENLNKMKGMEFLKTFAPGAGGDVEKGLQHFEECFDMDMLKASKMSDNENEEYILLRNDLQKKSHDGYFLEKSIRFKPDYLHSDPLFGKSHKIRSLEECLAAKENSLANNTHVEIMESVSKATSTTKSRRTGTRTFLQELFDMGPHSKDSVAKQGAMWNHNERNFTPYRTNPIGMDYVRTVVQKPIEEVYRRKENHVFT